MHLCSFSAPDILVAIRQECISAYLAKWLGRGTRSNTIGQPQDSPPAVKIMLFTFIIECLYM